MKVIFLDHDGVVCLSNNWGGRYKKAKKWCIKNGDMPMKDMPVDVRLDNFDKKSVDVLNRIIEQTDAEIVVSSDWKLHATLEELQSMYKTYGVIKSPIAVTPRLEEFDEDSAGLFRWKGWLERARCLEIQHWLSKNEVDAWVAVDDLNMSDEYLKPGLKHSVLTAKSSEGIKQSGISNKIISILNKDETVL